MSRNNIALDFQEPTDRILRLREVQKIINVSRSTLWRWERLGQFPRRVRLSTSNRNALTGWKLSHINNWLNSRQLSHTSTTIVSATQTQAIKNKGEI